MTEMSGLCGRINLKSSLSVDKVEPRKEWIDENVEFTLEDDYKI